MQSGYENSSSKHRRNRFFVKLYLQTIFSIFRRKQTKKTEKQILFGTTTATDNNIILRLFFFSFNFM